MGPEPASVGLLAGLRVVDATDIRGALCARLLADLGAEVIRLKAEVFEGPAHQFRNAQKTVSQIDIGSREASALIDAADVLIENQVGDPSSIRGERPHLIHVSIADMGHSGERSSWHLEPLPAFASSGALWASGFPDRPPCWMPGFTAHDCASVFGALGAITALIDRRRTGQGDLVEVSVQEAALSGLVPWSIAYRTYHEKVSEIVRAEGTRNADGSYLVSEASDGWVRAVLGTPKQWDGYFEMMGKPEALSDPMWRKNVFRNANVDVTRIIANETLSGRTRQELFDEALAVGTTVGVVQTMAEFLDHPQTISRGMFSTTEAGRMQKAPWRIDGEQPNEVAPAAGPVESAAFSAPRSSSVDGGGPTSELPLAGTLVVEFGNAAVGPELVWVLSELGADVVKIESSAKPDVLRYTGMGDLDKGFAFNVEARGRRTIDLDLKSEVGLRMAKQLCAMADVIVENNRGGMMGRRGLDYADVKEVNPTVVYAASQGYGRGGPLGDMPAFGPLNSAFAGTHLIWNHPDGPYPCGTSLNHPDHIAGKLCGVAVLAALDHRNRTGEGHFIDMAQTEACAYMAGHLYLQTEQTGASPAPLGNTASDQSPHDVYAAKGAEDWLAVAVPDDAAWQRLLDVTGMSAKSAWATTAGRLSDRDGVDAAVARWVSGRSAVDAASLLQSAGVSACPVMGPDHHHADAHLRERSFLVELDHAKVGKEWHVGNPMRFSRIPLRTAASAPLLGEHTDEIIAEFGLV